jgi:acetylornithine deacetylase/succinyl-diaminopimelate desuccinylase-like protein
MKNNLPNGARDYILECSGELKELIWSLCRIPSPSYNEGNRAIFIRNWFEKHCAGADAYIDDAQNVVCCVNVSPDVPVSVFIAHTDTVFPDLVPLEPEERDGCLYCPGVGDNTANLALMMLAARYVVTRKLPSREGILFVGNSCEEGLGNLKGCRKIMEDYAGRVKQLIAFDGPLGEITNRAVGSSRYRITLTAEGGHSFSCFGNTNAIHLLSLCIADLYAITPPESTTYNVGHISGGTSVNSIAEKAEMLYEYRSADREGLTFMERKFREIIERHRPSARNLEVELLGERPCNGDIDPAAQEALEQKAMSLIYSVTDKEVKVRAASTDCNIPLSQGIPAIGLGGYYGKGNHTYGEFIELASLSKGFELFLNMILQITKKGE